MAYNVLTADDLKAIKASTAFVARIEPGEESGTATLRVMRDIRQKDRDPFTDDRSDRQTISRTITINADSTAQQACFVGLYNPGNWTAFKALVKAGDAILIRARENGNGYCRAAKVYGRDLTDRGERSYHPEVYNGLFVDELCVSVYRKGKLLVDDFVLCSSVCPDNTARPWKSIPRANNWTLTAAHPAATESHAKWPHAEPTETATETAE